MRHYTKDKPIPVDEFVKAGFWEHPPGIKERFIEWHIICLDSETGKLMSTEWDYLIGLEIDDFEFWEKIKNPETGEE